MDDADMNTAVACGVRGCGLYLYIYLGSDMVLANMHATVVEVTHRPYCCISIV